MKNFELEGLLYGIQGHPNPKFKIKGCEHYKGASFAYKLAKNKKKVVDEINCLQEGIKPSEKFIEFSKKKEVFLIEHAKKDERGKPVKFINDNKQEEYDIPNMIAFVEAMKPLSEEYKEIITEREKQAEDYNKFMMEDVKDLKFDKITKDDLPEDISGDNITRIFEIID